MYSKPCFCVCALCLLSINQLTTPLGIIDTLSVCALCLYPVFTCTLKRTWHQPTAGGRARCAECAVTFRTINVQRSRRNDSFSCGDKAMDLKKQYGYCVCVERWSWPKQGSDIFMTPLS